MYTSELFNLIWGNSQAFYLRFVKADSVWYFLAFISRFRGEDKNKAVEDIRDEILRMHRMATSSEPREPPPQHARSGPHPGSSSSSTSGSREGRLRDRSKHKTSRSERPRSVDSPSSSMERERELNAAKAASKGGYLGSVRSVAQCASFGHFLPAAMYSIEKIIPLVSLLYLVLIWVKDNVAHEGFWSSMLSTDNVFILLALKKLVKFNSPRLLPKSETWHQLC